jgi:hypothetical protein
LFHGRAPYFLWNINNVLLRFAGAEFWKQAYAALDGQQGKGKAKWVPFDGQQELGQLP